MDDWIDILRDCWTGTPAARSYQHYEVPEGVLCYPTPLREPPILIGGDSPPALRRTARRGDGWLGFSYTDELDPIRIRDHIATIRCGGRSSRTGTSDPAGCPDTRAGGAAGRAPGRVGEAWGHRGRDFGGLDGARPGAGRLEPAPAIRLAVVRRPATRAPNPEEESPCPNRP